MPLAYPLKVMCLTHSTVWCAHNNVSSSICVHQLFLILIHWQIDSIVLHCAPVSSLEGLRPFTCSYRYIIMSVYITNCVSARNSHWAIVFINVFKRVVVRAAFRVRWRPSAWMRLRTAVPKLHQTRVRTKIKKADSACLSCPLHNITDIRLKLCPVSSPLRLPGFHGRVWHIFMSFSHYPRLRCATRCCCVVFTHTARRFRHGRP